MARPLRAAPGRSYRHAAASTIVVGGLVSAGMAVLMTGMVTGGPVAGASQRLLTPTGSSSAAPSEVAVSQTTGSTVCDTSTCTNADLYGGTSGPLLPGRTRSITMRFTNTGDHSIGTRRLVAGNCVASTTPGVVGSTAPAGTNTLCESLRLQVFEGTPDRGKRLYDGMPAGIPASITLGALGVQATRVYTFRLTLPAAATSSSQGQTVTQPLTWTNNA